MATQIDPQTNQPPHTPGSAEGGAWDKESPGDQAAAVPRRTPGPAEGGDDDSARAPASTPAPESR